MSDLTGIMVVKTWAGASRWTFPANVLSILSVALLDQPLYAAQTFETPREGYLAFWAPGFASVTMQKVYSSGLLSIMWLAQFLRIELDL